MKKVSGAGLGPCYQDREEIEPANLHIAKEGPKDGIPQNPQKTLQNFNRDLYLYAINQL